jgi:hypothetical protein
MNTQIKDGFINISLTKDRIPIFNEMSMITGIGGVIQI